MSACAQGVGCGVGATHSRFPYRRCRAPPILSPPPAARWASRCRPRGTELAARPQHLPPAVPAVCKTHAPPRGRCPRPTGTRARLPQGCAARRGAPSAWGRARARGRPGRHRFWPRAGPSAGGHSPGRNRSGQWGWSAAHGTELPAGSAASPAGGRNSWAPCTLPRRTAGGAAPSTWWLTRTLVAAPPSKARHPAFPPPGRVGCSGGGVGGRRVGWERGEAAVALETTGDLRRQPPPLGAVVRLLILRAVAEQQQRQSGQRLPALNRGWRELA